MGIRLKDGDRVCIVGGGPAGCFAALHLLRLSEEANLHLEVLIFESRDFSMPGPAGCNSCAGVLSSNLLRGLDALGLKLSADVIRSTVRAYHVYLDGEPTVIERPDPDREIITVYRGGGPRLLPGGPVAGFDRFLLDRAIQQGAQLIPHYVRRIAWEGRHVVTASGESYPADFLVLATGVNARLHLDPRFGYEPPPTETMAQDFVLRPPDWCEDCVSVFFGAPSGLTFGAIVPKGEGLNISLLGRGLGADTIARFLEAQGLTQLLAAERLCGCQPRISVGSAKGFFGDRWVAVGDAAVTRLYKDGIGSAYQTAERAMHVAISKGIAAADFRRDYVPLCRAISRDNLCGRALFRMWGLSLGSARLMEAWQRAVESEVTLKPEERIHSRVLWGMVTGNEAYCKLLALVLGPKAIASILRGLWPSDD